MDTPWVSLASKNLLVISLCAVLWVTSSLPATDRLRIRLVLITTCTLFFGPLAWMHYYTLPLLLFLGFALGLGLRWTVLWAIPVWFGFSHAWMGALLKNATAFPFETMYPQHTALLSLSSIVAVAVLAVSITLSKPPHVTIGSINQTG